MNIVLQLITEHPLGFIGVILSIVGIFFGISGNLWGWVGLALGIILAFISEKG